MSNTEDRNLLNYKTYEDYLDSFITTEDLKFLQCMTAARKIVECGYRSSTEILSHDQFYIRINELNRLLFPSRKNHILSSAGVKITDTFLSELAIRERANRLKLLATIIFLRDFTKSGFEISGYIDFEQSLRKSTNKTDDSIDWNLIFMGKKKLWPQKTDLGYYNWRSGISIQNDTANFKIVIDADKGLLFRHRGDREMICVDPFLKEPGPFTTRTNIVTNEYHHIVLYDHVVRNRL